MSKKKTAKKTSTQPKTKTAPRRMSVVPLPPMLVALAAIVQESHDHENLRAALRAAQATLRQKEVGDYPDAIHAYIDHFATTGWNKEAVAQAAQLEKAHKLDLFGGLHNAFAVPGILAGLAIAYVVLMNDGGGGAR